MTSSKDDVIGRFARSLARCVWRGSGEEEDDEENAEDEEKTAEKEDEEGEGEEQDDGEDGEEKAFLVCWV